MKWGLWSVTAGSNSATPPDGWPEGQAPSTVNDCAREMMAQIRTGINNIQFVDLGVTPTQTGNTTFTLAGNQMQWYSYGNRVQANVGGTIYTGTVISSTYTTNTGVTLRFDAGQGSMTPLTNSLSAVATGFPSAASGALPEMVWRRRNMIINSCMDIWQRGNGPYKVSGGPIDIYTADRWVFEANMTAVAAVNISRFERSANASFVPTVAQAGLLITNAYGISVSAAMATINNGTYACITQKIEGYTFRQLAQKPLTISFWVNSRQTGTYCLALRNAGVNQSCVLQYSVSSVATWEKKTLTFPKSPVTGTWDYSIGIGLAVSFVLVAGATFQGGAGNWTAANIMATSAQTNFMTSAGNVLMLTGVQVEEGIQVTPLEPVDIAMESQRCSRYYYQIGTTNGNLAIVGVATSPNASLHTIVYPQQRAANPAITFTTPNGTLYTANYNGLAGLSVSAATAFTSFPNQVTVGMQQVGAGTLTAGGACGLLISAGGAIKISSEL